MSRVHRLTAVMALNLALVAGLVIVGLRAHSLGVLSAGVDYLADASAIGVSLLAIWLAGRPAPRGRPGRYRNATTVAALVNAGWLLVVCGGIVAGGARRLAVGAPQVDGLLVLAASAVAAVVMAAGALILRGGDDDGDDEDLNMKAVLLDTAADAAAAGGVAVAGGIILALRGLYWLDSVAAMAIAVVVAYHALRLVRDAVSALRSARTGGETGAAARRPAADR